ncbi:MAG: RNA polymerase sigma-70 factor [Bacteroidales bacterium]|nr:RNA polymerase sigma-70 factor [Bacteroidales bacterium]
MDIDRLFRLYYKPMCLYAMHYLNDTDAVEDIVQDAFVSLWQKAEAGSVPMQPRAYLLACVRNACIDLLRRQQSHPQDAMPADAAGADTEEEALAGAEKEAALWAAVDSLPPGRRKMLLMHKRDGLSHKAIAERLGVSEGTVRNQISRALKKLRNK